MAHQFGDVLLVPFPFTDQSASKQRPGVIVSSAAYHRARRDLVLMPITSQLRGSGAFGEVMVQDWQAAKLLKLSRVNQRGHHASIKMTRDHVAPGSCCS